MLSLPMWNPQIENPNDATGLYSCAQNKPTFSLIMKQIKGQSSTKKQV